MDSQQVSNANSRDKEINLEICKLYEELSLLEIRESSRSDTTPVCTKADDHASSSDISTLEECSKSKVQTEISPGASKSSERSPIKFSIKQRDKRDKSSKPSKASSNSHPSSLSSPFIPTSITGYHSSSSTHKPNPAQKNLLLLDKPPSSSDQRCQHSIQHPNHQTIAPIIPTQRKSSISFTKPTSTSSASTKASKSSTSKSSLESSSRKTVLAVSSSEEASSTNSELQVLRTGGGSRPNTSNNLAQTCKTSSDDPESKRATSTMTTNEADSFSTVVAESKNYWDTNKFQEEEWSAAEDKELPEAQWTLDPSSGFWYDAVSGMYFDHNCGMYYRDGCYFQPPLTTVTQAEAETSGEFRLLGGEKVDEDERSWVAVTDTNCFMREEQMAALQYFKKTRDRVVLVVPEAVVRELDGLKRDPGDKGASARSGVALVRDAVREGAPWVRLQVPGETLAVSRPFGESRCADDDILGCAAYFAACEGSNQRSERRVILLTSDSCLELKARARNLNVLSADDFVKSRKQRVIAQTLAQANWIRNNV